MFPGRGSRSERRAGDGGNVLIRTGQEEWPGRKDKGRAGRSFVTTRFLLTFYHGKVRKKKGQILRQYLAVRPAGGPT
ncbi:MAG: hypothetical protein KAT76_07815, partial [Bacteroidales bacterium]|nr:hypothetical protein [Bacteroidales bacterium]